jgi:hypothetical protein
MMYVYVQILRYVCAQATIGKSIHQEQRIELIPSSKLLMIIILLERHYRIAQNGTRSENNKLTMQVVVVPCGRVEARV